MIEERKREREKERTTIIYILSIDFLRCSENSHQTPAKSELQPTFRTYGPKKAEEPPSAVTFV